MSSGNLCAVFIYLITLIEYCLPVHLRVKKKQNEKHEKTQPTLTIVKE